MNMTHYMELLATNQPWNLILFMAIPMIMAETLAIAEMYLLYTRHTKGKVSTLSKILGVIIGIYFLIMAIYLITKVAIPLTVMDQWRTVIDVVAVWAYILAAIPIIYIGLLCLNMVGRGRDAMAKLKRHSIAIAFFLVLSHVAMIAGMTSPAVLGWQNNTPMQMQPMQDHSMPKMPHQH